MLRPVATREDPFYSCSMSGKTRSPEVPALPRGVSPSDFMRKMRPEQYSDSAERSAYKLDASALEQRLDTLTARNQTHDFEIFCRMLCERLICPNLKPATGPEGGGDSKADSETIATADEVMNLTYVGAANAGRERWAFAFSAKKAWRQKARSDIDGLAATGRAYDKVFFVTSQYARARDRAALEDEMSTKHGFRVEILDRSWITAKVIKGNQKDLAFEYLGVGEQLAAHRLGPADYARMQQLEDLEKVIQDPAAYEGQPGQRAADALSAALLSRELERPRFETDGRFQRAIRLADDHGLLRQRLDARYQMLWTAFYWFDDFDLLDREYDAFAEIVFASDMARNVELVGNLTQNLVNLVMHGHRSAEQVKLAARMGRLVDRLKTLAADKERPNNALEARTSLLIVQANELMLTGDTAALPGLWPQFTQILQEAEGLVEYSAERLVQMIEVYGTLAGRDPGYSRLVDELAAFVSRRTGEGESGLILLKRANQLDGEEDRFELIRILGRATRQLAKKEYVESLVEATYLLALAYRGMGMLWAARAHAMFAVASIFVEAETEADLPASIVPALMLLGWIDVELRLLPELLDVVRLVRGCRESLPLTEDSLERVADRLERFDVVLASQMVNLGAKELAAAASLPDLFGGLGLEKAQGALLYALGYETLIIDEATLADSEALAKIRETFVLLASQPAGDPTGTPLITYGTTEQVIETRVLGMRVAARFLGSDVLIQVAETLLAVIETLFATTLAARVGAHVERFEIRIEEHDGLEEPVYEIDEVRARSLLKWPSGVAPTSFALDGRTHQTMTYVASMVFVASCVTDNPLSLIEQLYRDEALGERISTAVASAASRSRAFTSAASRLSDWVAISETSYPPTDNRPLIVRRKLDPIPSEDEVREVRGADFEPAMPRDHRDLEVRAILEVPLWERSGWAGLLSCTFGAAAPPIMAFVFDNRDIGREIFSRWRERFGKRDTNGDIHFAILRNLPGRPPAHYAALLTAGRNGVSEVKVTQMVSRLKVLEPSTDENLQRFLSAYEAIGCYGIAPAVIGEDGEPELMFNLAILKRDLPVRNFDEIQEGELEHIGRMLLEGPRG